MYGKAAGYAAILAAATATEDLAFDRVHGQIDNALRNLEFKNKHQNWYDPPRTVLIPHAEMRRIRITISIFPLFVDIGIREWNDNLPTFPRGAGREGKFGGCQMFLEALKRGFK